MPEESKAQPVQADPTRNVVHLHTERTTTAYSSFTVTVPAAEELTILFGIPVLPPRQANELDIDVGQRIIMTWPSAKRLAINLGNLLQQYEAAHGVISLQPQAPQPAASRPAAEKKG